MKKLPIHRLQLRIIFAQALIAMLGSLYFSNFGDPVANIAAGTLFPAGAGFAPCQMCWWGRILMYPIVAISFLALITNDKKAFKYIIALSVPGSCLEAYHYLLQKLDFATSQACTFANPCNAMSVDYFGFITIPFLCLTAFVVILLTATYRK